MPLMPEDFFTPEKPNFAPTAGPMTFGIELGSNSFGTPGAMLQGHLGIDNFTVDIDFGVTMFKDGFESDM